MDDSRKKAEWAHMMVEALNDLDKAAKKSRDTYSPIIPYIVQRR